MVDLVLLAMVKLFDTDNGAVNPPWVLRLR